MSKWNTQRLVHFAAVAVFDFATEVMHNRVGVVRLRGRSLSAAAAGLIDELKRVDGQ